MKKLNLTITIEDTSIFLYMKDLEEEGMISKEFSLDKPGIRCLSQTIGKKIIDYLPVNEPINDDKQFKRIFKNRKME